jgi:hypothetical protein
MTLSQSARNESLKMDDILQIESSNPTPPSFTELAASRREWIETVLKPWAGRARRTELLLADQEWTDVAGKVDPAKTLWAWAWSRFPGLVHGDLGIDEALEVEVRLRDGRTFAGYPDVRQSERGQLVLYGRRENGEFGDLGPFSIDDIASVEKTAADM